MLPEDAGGGGGVGLLTSDVMLSVSVNEMFKSYTHSHIHTLVAFFIRTKTVKHVPCNVNAQRRSYQCKELLASCTQQNQ
jgi:hypothetical protein